MAKRQAAALHAALLEAKVGGLVCVCPCVCLCVCTCVLWHVHLRTLKALQTRSRRVVPYIASSRNARTVGSRAAVEKYGVR